MFLPVVMLLIKFVKRGKYRRHYERVMKGINLWKIVGLSALLHFFIPIM
jgi:hypothetical protein